MMNTISITVPAHRTDLLNEIQTTLGDSATVHTKSPQSGRSVSFGGQRFNESTEVVVNLTKLAIGGLGVVTAGYTAATAKKTWDILNRRKEKGEADDISITGQDGETKQLNEMDEAGWLQILEQQIVSHFTS